MSALRNRRMITAFEVHRASPCLRPRQTGGKAGSRLPLPDTAARDSRAWQFGTGRDRSAGDRL